MKKFLGVLISLLLLVPVVASAAPTTIEQAGKVADVALMVTVTDGITGAGYYTDYQAFVNRSDKEVELFCVENEPALVNRYVHYETFKLTSSLHNIQAAWIAENYWNASSDSDKGQAQLAVWDLLNTISDGSIVATGSLAERILAMATADGIQDFTSNWLVAINDGRQDYLVRAAPVPEPATMLLLGTGLVGLAGMSRRKFKK